jgi:uncharacterized protein with GYD domain
MATFIMLSRLSPEGMKTLRNNPERLREVNQEVEGFGARVVQQYALLGPYDFITVLEAPDAGTVSRVSVELASRATASYETLSAISVEEFISRVRGEWEGTYATTERSEEAAPPGREGARQPESEGEEDKGLIDRARDAIIGEEEVPRRREGTDRADREDRPSGR